MQCVIKCTPVIMLQVAVETACTVTVMYYMVFAIQRFTGNSALFFCALYGVCCLCFWCY